MWPSGPGNYPDPRAFEIMALSETPFDLSQRIKPTKFSDDIHVLNDEIARDLQAIEDKNISEEDDPIKHWNSRARVMGKIRKLEIMMNG